MKFHVGSRVLHVRSGKEYLIMEGPARLRIEDGAVPAYMYRPYWFTEDGTIWVRPAMEMEDGRFRLVQEPVYQEVLFRTTNLGLLDDNVDIELP